MKRTDKNRRTKRGASSLFLAVIMSALILVECTFVAFVWNLDYALSVNEALKTQIDTILCDYNRQLFDVYGIYAFTLDEVDDECFCKALEINGPHLPMALRRAATRCSRSGISPSVFLDLAWLQYTCARSYSPRM